MFTRNRPRDLLLHQAYQAQTDLMWPLRTVAKLAAQSLQDVAFGGAAWTSTRRFAAACRVLELAAVTHKRPPWNIGSIEIKADCIPVIEETALTTPFATLLRFRKEGAPAQSKVLVVAPMSGHFATLLRDTVRTVLRDHDVYVTDWRNVRDVPLEAGRFGIDEYTEHIIDFLDAIGPNASVIAVCQPCVWALPAVALMSEDDHPATPVSLTLMAGPIDCRVSPTAVNQLATSKPMAWLESNLISREPARHGGAGRRVCPGFVQLSAFVNMNKERHINAFKAYYQHLVDGEFETAEVLQTFYEEYMAVADLSADFDLETVRLVFQEYALARGQLAYRGRPAKPAAIRRCALLTVEGERDDICAIGQTMAAQDLASSLRSYLRTPYIQPNVGHYGVFSGKRWQHHLYPLVSNVIHTSQ